MSFQNKYLKKYIFFYFQNLIRTTESREGGVGDVIFMYIKNNG